MAAFPAGTGAQDLLSGNDRRHAVVIIVIASAIITPTGDPFTLTVVAVPLYLLYELSILMIKDKKLMMKRKKWRQRNDGL